MPWRQVLSMKIVMILVCLVAGLQVARLNAQTKAAAPLSDYVGTYAFAPGQTVEIVAGDELFAVVDEAKYGLKPSGRGSLHDDYG